MPIHPLAVVDPLAEVHPDATIGPFCVVKGRVVIDAGADLRNHATVYGRAHIGSGTVLFPSCVIGSDPQDLKYRGEDSEVVIGRNCQIHEFVTISKGTAAGGMATIIGDDCLLMAGCHIGHDGRVGDKVVIGNNTQVAGHVHIGRKAIINGMVGIHHFATIGDLAFIGAMSGIRTDVPPYVIADGVPTEVRNLNVVGLRRDGADDATITAMKDAFRVLFHDRSQTRAEAVEKVRSSGVVVAGGPVDRLCAWVTEHLEVSIRGRVQEAHRKTHAPVGATNHAGSNGHLGTGAPVQVATAEERAAQH